ncbi:hypothetical protein [Mesorhizobium sp. SARCC-RB16n]|uniref:hypothetical protein n=1 Tax=Mesorhizobium sp. SARCC-RB16n TaxID=2116687 RepID=UPI00166942BC|nr:hypothetical protein [Mesorhizobium sp. SARCC-RB16n]
MAASFRQRSSVSAVASFRPAAIRLAGNSNVGKQTSAPLRQSLMPMFCILPPRMFPSAVKPRLDLVANAAGHPHDDVIKGPFNDRSNRIKSRKTTAGTMRMSDEADNDTHIVNRLAYVRADPTSTTR